MFDGDVQNRLFFWGVCLYFTFIPIVSYGQESYTKRKYVQAYDHVLEHISLNEYEGFFQSCKQRVTFEERDSEKLKKLQAELWKPTVHISNRMLVPNTLGGVIDDYINKKYGLGLKEIYRNYAFVDSLCEAFDVNLITSANQKEDQKVIASMASRNVTGFILRFSHVYNDRWVFARLERHCVDYTKSYSQSETVQYLFEFTHGDGLINVYKGRSVP